MNFDWEEWYTQLDPMLEAIEYTEANISVHVALTVLDNLPPAMHGNFNFGTHTKINAGLYARILQVLPVTFMRPYVTRLAEDGKSATILVLRDDMHLLFTIDDSTYLKYKLSYTECSPWHGVEIEGGAHVTQKRGRAGILKKLLRFLED